MLKVCLPLLLYLAFYGSNAQTDEIKSNYSTAKASEFSEWLEVSNLDAYFAVDRIEWQGDSFTLFLNSSVCDSPNWTKLRNKYLSLHKIRIEDYLLQRLSFQLDTKRDLLSILIKCGFGDGFLVKIYFNDSRLIIHEDIQKQLGQGFVPIDLKDLQKVTGPMNGNLNTSAINSIRIKIKEFLQQYYAAKSGANFLYEPDFEILKDYYNNLFFTIDHVTNEILDRNYFERIRINITLEVKEEKVNIQYAVNAKYSASMLFRPFDSTFKDMESNEDFKPYVKEYEEKLFGQLQAHLTSP